MSGSKKEVATECKETEVNSKQEKKKRKKSIKSSERKHESEGSKSSTVLLESAKLIVNENQILAGQPTESEKITTPVEEVLKRVEKVSFSTESAEKQKTEEIQDKIQNDLSSINETTKSATALNSQSEVQDRRSLQEANLKLLLKLKEAFHLFDINRDGFIDKADLRFTFTSLGKPDVSDNHLECMLSEMSNPIDLDAFVEQFGHKAIELDSQDVLMEALSKWDYEGNGTISEERIRHDLQKWGDKFTNQEIDYALEEAPLYSKKGVTMIDYVSFTNNICGLRNVYKNKQSDKEAEKFNKY